MKAKDQGRPWVIRSRGAKFATVCAWLATGLGTVLEIVGWLS